MSSQLRIGNAHGFWGDRLEAAAEMLALEPDLDYLTLDFLAEVSMSILALQQQRDPAAGFARDFVEIVESLIPYYRSGGTCRVITNAGGLNPLACAEACRAVLQQAGCPDRTIAVVTGDDVLDLIRADAASSNASGLLRNLDTGESINHVIDKLVTANVYLGAQTICEALRLGADLVITGRVADPSLTVGACMHHFGWQGDAWNRIAGATVAGHLIECGTQVTGGIFTDWLGVPDVSRIGFPIVEVDEDGSCVVTKPRGSGGTVTPATVKEQLLYEIGDPECYLSPDATVSFASLQVEREADDRVIVRGAKGRPASETLKVSATYLAGYRATGQLAVFGKEAVTKARRAAEMVLDQLAETGVSFRHTCTDILGAGACIPSSPDEIAGDIHEVGLRISVADNSREAVEQFARSLMPLITAGPPGTTGYSEGRPRVHPQFAFWPCLIHRDRVQPKVELLSRGTAASHSRASPHVLKLPEPHTRASRAQGLVSRNPPREANTFGLAQPEDQCTKAFLGDFAHARSGDKGRHANIGVIARKPEFYNRLRNELTAACVAEFLGIDDADQVERFELPNLHALNFLVRNVLHDPLRLDSQGKALGQLLLQMPIDQRAETQLEISLRRPDEVDRTRDEAS